jgi:hypothetical protein
MNIDEIIEETKSLIRKAKQTTVARDKIKKRLVDHLFISGCINTDGKTIMVTDDKKAEFFTLCIKNKEGVIHLLDDFKTREEANDVLALLRTETNFSFPDYELIYQELLKGVIQAKERMYCQDPGFSKRKILQEYRTIKIGCPRQMGGTPWAVNKLKENKLAVLVKGRDDRQYSLPTYIGVEHKIHQVHSLNVSDYELFIIDDLSSVESTYIYNCLLDNFSSTEPFNDNAVIVCLN